LTLTNERLLTFWSSSYGTQTLPDWVRHKAAYLLGEIDPSNEEAIKFLTELIEQNKSLDLDAASTLGKIDPGNPKAIETLTELLKIERGDRVMNIPLIAACDLLEIDPENPEAISFLREFIKSGRFLCLWERLEAASALGKTQPLENQLTDISSQVQPTDKTYPIAIDTQSLKLETNTSAIAQKLCTKIYRKAGYSDIPTVSDAAQLQQYIPRIQEQLQKQNLALILHGCEPNEHLINFCYSLADEDIGLYIGLQTSNAIVAATFW
jgi:HEAT repeat protein